MATLYGFDKLSGSQLWSANIGSEVTSGEIDYVGNGQILLVTNANIALIDLDQKLFIKNIYDFDTGDDTIQNAYGVAINHGRHDPEFNGQQFYVAAQVLVGEQLTNAIYLFDLNPTPKIVKQTVALGTAIPHALAWNGMNLMCKVVVVSTHTYRLYDVGNQGNGVQVAGYGSNAAINDMAFDGQDYWIVDGSAIRVYDPDDFQPRKWGFLHGLTSPTGITTDGRQLLVLAPS